MNVTISNAEYDALSACAEMLVDIQTYDETKISLVSDGEAVIT